VSIVIHIVLFKLIRFTEHNIEQSVPYIVCKRMPYSVLHEYTDRLTVISLSLFTL